MAPERCATLTQKVLVAPLAAAAVAGLVSANCTGTATLSAHTVQAQTEQAITLVNTQLALIMTGTFVPFVSDQWINQVMGALITPILGDAYTGAPMTTPEEFWPVTGLTSLTFNASIRKGYGLLDARVRDEISTAPRNPLAVFGYSQSAIIASTLKRNLQTEYGDRKEVPPVSFTMIGNPLRPNGGLLARIPLVADVFTPWAGMYETPSDTRFATNDIVRQYDLWADFPTYPLNLLATINAVFGLANHTYLLGPLEGSVLEKLAGSISLDPGSPNYQPDVVVQNSGDTTYYLIPSKNLPLLYPLRWIGLGPVVDIIEPLVRVFVELGYDRNTPYGQTVRAGLFPKLTAGNIRTFIADVNAAIQQGGEALAKLFRPRMPATEPAGAPAAAPARSLAAASAAVAGPPTVDPVRVQNQSSITGPVTGQPARKPDMSATVVQVESPAAEPVAVPEPELPTALVTSPSQGGAGESSRAETVESALERTPAHRGRTQRETVSAGEDTASSSTSRTSHHRSERN